MHINTHIYTCTLFSNNHPNYFYCPLNELNTFLNINMRQMAEHFFLFISFTFPFSTAAHSQIKHRVGVV